MPWQAPATFQSADDPRAPAWPEDQAGIQPRRFLSSYASLLCAVSASWGQGFSGGCQPSSLLRSCAGMGRRGKGAGVS